MLCNPIALIKPDGVSSKRCGSEPILGLGVKLLETIPPSKFRSTISVSSSPYPKHPLAVMIGFFNLIGPSSTDRSGFIVAPDLMEKSDHLCSKDIARFHR